jgi:hypothetical protein
MFVDCVLASSRISQVDPGDEPLPEVVLSQYHRALTEEKQFQNKNFQAQDSTSCFHGKLYKATCPNCIKHSQAR